MCYKSHLNVMNSMAVHYTSVRVKLYCHIGGTWNNLRDKFLNVLLRNFQGGITEEERCTPNTGGALPGSGTPE